MVVGAVVAFVALAFVVEALTSEWSGARSAFLDASPGWIALAFVLASVAMVAVALGWHLALRLVGADLDAGPVMAWYFTGELGKYVPGGLWTVVGRAELAHRGGAARSRAYASVALSLVGLYLAAAVVGAGVVPVALANGAAVNWWMLPLVAVPGVVALLHHQVLTSVLALARRLSRRPLDLDVPRWGASVRLVVRYVPCWLLIGLSTWALARSLTPDVSFSRLLAATVLAWLAGFLAVPVPAGAGVREAVLVALCGLPAGTAALTAIASRVVFILVDAFGAAVSAAHLARCQRRVTARQLLSEGG